MGDLFSEAAGRRLGALPVLLGLSRRRLPARPDLDATLDVLRSRDGASAQNQTRQDHESSEARAEVAGDKPKRRNQSEPSEIG